MLEARICGYDWHSPCYWVLCPDNKVRKTRSVRFVDGQKIKMKDAELDDGDFENSEMEALLTRVLTAIDASSDAASGETSSKALSELALRNIVKTSECFSGSEEWTSGWRI